MSATKKPSTNVKKTNQKRKPVKKELGTDRKWSILLFGIGAIILAMTFVEGEAVWKAIRTAIFGVFGIGMYFVGPLIIFIAVLIAMGKPFWGRLSKAIILILFIQGTALVFSNLPIQTLSFKDALIALYNSGAQAMGGGLLSAIVGWSLLMLCGRPAANIILVVLIVVGVMLFTGITPVDIARFFSAKADKAREKSKLNNRQRDDMQSSEMQNERVIKKDAIIKPKYKASPIIDVNLGPDAIETIDIEEEQKPTIGPGGTFGMYPPIDTREQLQQEPFDEDSDDKLKAEAYETENEIIEKAAPIIDSMQAELPSQTPLEQPIEELIKKAIGIRPELEIDANEQVEIVPARSDKEGYTYPPLSLFHSQAIADEDGVEQELSHNAELLVKTLSSFGVETRILDISRGPSVTRYELQPSAGVKISRITGLADDIALNLATAGVRIEAPIPNKAAVGIEVPNRMSVSVSIRSILESASFAKSQSPLSIALGKDIAGMSQVADLTKMPHLLIAGSTGSGKSVCINSIIVSILYKSSPEDVKLIMVDPKVVELAEYNGIPHLLMPVVTDARKAAGALGSAVAEMEKRYQLFAEYNVRDIKTYNKLVQETDGMEKMPYIAIIIDELADLMMVAGKEVEDYICRIAQKARAAGMHLIVATQRPSVDVITGLIKANIPSRIAFAVSSQIDSRTILDTGGAEKLLGMGDMLFQPVGASKPIRIQGTYVKDEEITAILNFIKKHGSSDYNEAMIEEMEKRAVPEKASGNNDNSDDNDPMLKTAVEVIIDAGMASTSLLQRKCKLGYARAARIMDEMEALHIIGPYEGSKPRQVLISRQQWIEMTMQNSEMTDNQ